MTTGVLTNFLNTAANQTDWAECARQCRQVLVSAVDYMFEKAETERPKGASLLELIEHPVVTSYINDPDLISSLHYVRILGMNAEHGRSVRKKEAALALENITYIVGLLKAKETGTDAAYHKPPYMSEALTRRLYVDQYLKEAGWDILDTENVIQPGKAGIEIEVHGMPNHNGIGYCDYVLYGKNGQPLAIVEVKKTSVSPEKGRHQVNLYADCMEKQYGYRPVLYYTNGYATKIIDGSYPDRDVHAFHAREELERLLQRRKLGPITNLNINREITGRPYQTIAITNICEWLNQKHRRGLLVMATGTGKTRVAISLVDVLTRNKWVKNVLFLADRVSLVNQAKRNFAHLMPDMSICELSAAGEKDLNARLIFCTYQTMINYIDAEDKAFTTGRFDLIIIDEAHRSIFNRYGTIFKYFDSLLIGLTATPKNEVDANTYKIFGCEAGVPNFDYSLEEAIQDKYLVGYHVINRTSKLLEQGIKYSELTPEQREQLEDYLPDDTPSPEFDIPGSELFKYLFNEDTCRKVLEELMRWGYRVDEGETMGKTIIFAYNHKHAQMIVDLFREMYPQYHENYCQLVDYSVNYGEDLVIKFGEDPNFRIAVSVDMLDTGIDVPAVLNLVFFKKVRSKIKFVQMIGRGTRLCRDIYGPGKHKSGFQIFDYCGNFEYFGEHPDGKEGKEMLTLSQRLFQIRLDILYELQKMEYQQDTWFHAYYDQIKTELHNDVIRIKSHDSRIQVREAMQYVDKYYDLQNWVCLSPVEVKEIKRHISPLLDSGLNGDHVSGDYQYVILPDGTAEVIYFTGRIAEVIIPEQLDGIPLTSVRGGAFEDNDALTRVVFPSTVTCIGEYAFDYCHSLAEVVVPASVTSIGEGAFSGCPVTVTVAPDSYAEQYCKDYGVAYIVEEPEIFTDGDYQYILLEDGTASIVGYSGKEAELTVTDMVNGIKVTEIGDYAFYNNSYLNSVILPDGVIRIGPYAFGACWHLVSISIPESVTEIGDYAFYGCEIMESIRIPASVTSIGTCAFSGCYALTSVSIPDSVTNIGLNPFVNCKKLTEIKVSLDHPSLATIDGVLFSKPDRRLVCYPCAFIAESYTIPQGIQFVGDGAFLGCAVLTSVTIPDSVTSIGGGAFQGCNSLLSVQLPDSLTDIGDGAFGNCESLAFIAIPDSVSSIGKNPFVGCSKLTGIDVSLDHPYLATIDGTLFSKADKRLVCYPCALTAESYTIPQGIRIIGESAFSSCEALVSVTIPDSVISMEDRAFEYCKALASVSLPSGMTRIEEHVFEGCNSLESVTIPSGVTSIGDFAFWYCSSLKSAEIPDSVTDIGNSAFRFCSALTTVTIPDSVTHIGNGAFSDCYALTSFNIPDGMAYLPDVMFSGCKSLTSILIPDSVTTIGEGAFTGCSSLESVAIPENVTSIGNSAFYGCRSLASVIIPPSVTSIENFMFNGCESLSSVSIPDGVTSIGISAFYNCTALSDITIPDSVDAIGRHAFFGCTSLTSLSLPSSVTRIGLGAFTVYQDGEYIPNPDLTITVSRDSYAKQYCVDKGLKYIYPDSLDWLNN